MNVNVLQVSTGTEPSASVVQEEKCSTRKKIFVYVLSTLGGMDTAVQQLNSVKMVSNGMSLSSCASVPMQASGTELIV